MAVTVGTPHTYHATINTKDAADTLYTLITARTGRFLLQKVQAVATARSGSGTVAQFSLGTETTTYENIINEDSGFIRVSGGVNYVPIQVIVNSSGEDYIAYADLATNGLKLRLRTQFGGTSETAVIAVTGVII